MVKRVESIELDKWEKYKPRSDKTFVFGPYYSHQFWNSPRHIIFSLSRYKFAAKMIGSNKKVLELGASEGLGSHYLAEFARSVFGVDFDEEAIACAQKNLESEKLQFYHDDFLGSKYGDFDAVVSYDVIEHIYPIRTDKFCRTVVDNLQPRGIAVIGTPNQEAEKYSSKDNENLHFNIFSWDRLTQLLEKYFHNVFLFSMNDEIVHTGYYPMAHYFLALCVGPKK